MDFSAGWVWRWSIGWCRHFRSMVLLVLAALAGCIQTHPIPNFARPGDYLTLGLGGIQRNVGGEQYLTASDLSIVLTDAASHTFTLQPITFCKAYPDYASTLTQGIAGGGAIGRPFDGSWFIMLRLIDSLGAPLGLAPGAATIRITSPTNKLTNTALSAPIEGDFNNIPITILPAAAGTGVQVGGYENHANQCKNAANIIEIAPQSLASVPVGGVTGLQLVIKYPKAGYRRNPLVVPFSHNPYIQLAQRVVDSGDGIHNTLNVLLTTQNAFVIGANQIAETPLLSDLTLRLMYFTDDYGPAQLQDFVVDTARSRYVDGNGNLIPNMQPILSGR